VECTSPAGAPVALDASASTDPDGDLASYRWREGATTLASEAAATVTLSIAAHDVVLEVTDATHLTTEDTAVITVGDTTAPVLAAPTNVHAECAAHGGTAVTLGTPVANDACDAAPAVTVAGIPDGAIFPLGETAVIWKAKDAHQNEATASQSVVIADSTPPVLSGVPGPMSEEATSEAGASLTLAVPTAADVCDPAPAVTSDAPAIFPVGITVVTFTARDASGNSATATTEVTVTALDRGVRTAPPSCLCGPGAVSPGWALAALAGLALRRRPRRPGR
jgi:hypothetical protein